MCNSNCTDCSPLSYEETSKSLEFLDLWLPFERLIGAQAPMQASLRHLRTADRAVTLGIGSETVGRYHRMAIRDHAQCTRQLEVAKAAFQDRLNDQNWLSKVRDLDPNMNTVEFQDQMAETRERVVEIIFDSGASGDRALEMLQTWDQATNALSGGIESMVQWVNLKIDGILQALNLPNEGANSGDVVLYSQASVAACIAVAVGIAAAASAACYLIPFCWCCFMTAILSVLFSSLALCSNFA